MKKAILFLTATFILFFGMPASSPAQKTATWQGGAPGKVSEWNCAANWKEGRVPNAFSDAVIPDVSTGSGAFPVISSPVEAVNSLTLLSGAQLIINRAGKLEVYFALETYGVCKLHNLGTLIAPSFRGNPRPLARSVSANQ